MSESVAAILRVCNEEYWIAYCLDALLKIGRLPIYVADTGSTDKTMEIIRSRQCDRLHVYDFGKLKHIQFGKVWQFLAEESKAEWVLPVGGDEIFTALPTALDAFAQQLEDHPNLDIIGARLNMQNITWQDGQFHLSSIWYKRKIVRGDLQWGGTIGCDSIESADELDRWPHLKFQPFAGYHMRYVQRSSKDHVTPKRVKKMYCNEKLIVGDKIDLFEQIGPPSFYNPYWNSQADQKFQTLWEKSLANPDFKNWHNKWMGSNPDGQIHD